MFGGARCHFGPKGLLVSAGADGSLCAWDLPEPPDHAAGTVRVGDEGARCLAASPDGREWAAVLGTSELARFDAAIEL